MNKSIVKSVSDEDFMNIVKNSGNVNDIARGLGFAHTPGGNSRKSIKSRMVELNIDFGIDYITLTEEANDEIEEIRVMEGWHSKEIGDVGEAHFAYACALERIPSIKITTENSPYDYLIEINGKFKKIQVKTTAMMYTDRVNFRPIKSYKIKQQNHTSAYSIDDVDYFYMFNAVNGEGYLIKNTGALESVTLRYRPSRNNQVLNIRYAKDYIFNKVINKPPCGEMDIT